MNATYLTKDGVVHSIDFNSNAKQWSWKKSRAIESIKIQSFFELGPTLLECVFPPIIHDCDFVLLSVDGIPVSDHQCHSAIVDDIPHFALDGVYGMNDCRCYYACDSLNSKGERLLIELSYCYDSGYRDSLPKLWKKHGYTDRVVETYWHFDTYVYKLDENGREICYRGYDPSVKPGGAGYVVDFDWLLDATPENARKLFAEGYERFMNA